MATTKCASCGAGAYQSYANSAWSYITKVSPVGSTEATDCIDALVPPSGGYDFIYADATLVSSPAGWTGWPAAGTAITQAIVDNACAATCDADNLCMYFYTTAIAGVANDGDFKPKCHLVKAGVAGPGLLTEVTAGIKVADQSYTMWKLAGADGAKVGSADTDNYVTASFDVATHTYCADKCDLFDKCVAFVFDGTATGDKCLLRVGAFDPAVMDGAARTIPSQFLTYTYA